MSMGINETRMKRVWATPIPDIAMLVVLLPILGLGLVFYLQRSRHPHRNFDEIKSKTKLRGHVLGLTIFAGHHGYAYPAQEHWPHALLESNDIDADLLLSPVETDDGAVSYIYVPGPLTFDADQILIYEDPEHWPKKGVLVGFADGEVRFVPFDEFDQMLAAQKTQNINMLKSKTYIRGLMIGVQSFANNANGGVLPTQDQWPDSLARWMNMDLLVSPVEDGDGDSYFYVPGPNTQSATQILIYEDPAHWPKHGVLVGFSDNHTEFMEFDEFEQMLADQTQQADEP